MSRPGRERICAAIDFPTWREAEPFARAVAPEVGMLKVGLELFAAEGPPAVRAAAALGRPVFLDLKLHDIPNTVEGAARSAAAAGRRSSPSTPPAGDEMVRAAVRGARRAAPRARRHRAHQPRRRRARAHRPGRSGRRRRGPAGAPGGGGRRRRARLLARTRWPRSAPPSGPGPLLVVPGVRPPGAARGDQARVATPAEAVAAGADVVVIGRPLREGGDPAAAARAIAATLDRRGRDGTGTLRRLAALGGASRRPSPRSWSWPSSGTGSGAPAQGAPGEVTIPDLGTTLGGLLGLLGLLLAFTFGMAGERFDRRKTLVVEEANAIGTAWLRDRPRARADACAGPRHPPRVHAGPARRGELRKRAAGRRPWSGRSKLHEAALGRHRRRPPRPRPRRPRRSSSPR